MKNYFLRFVPSKNNLQRSKALKPIASLVGNQRLWYMNRHTVAAGFAIGVFFSLQPIVGHMLLAALCAILLRANLPVAVAATWVNNPFTMPLFIALNYYVGTRLLNVPMVSLEHIDWNIHTIITIGEHIAIPLVAGSLLVGLIAALISYFGIRLVWRFIILRKRAAKKHRH